MSSISELIIRNLIDGITLDWPDKKSREYFVFEGYTYLLGIHGKITDLQKKSGVELYLSQFYISLANNLFDASGVLQNNERVDLKETYKQRIEWLIEKGSDYLTEIEEAWTLKVERFGVLTGLRITGDSPKDFEASVNEFLDPNFVYEDSYSDERYPNLLTIINKIFAKKKSYTFIEMGQSAGLTLLEENNFFKQYITVNKLDFYDVVKSNFKQIMKYFTTILNNVGSYFSKNRILDIGYLKKIKNTAQNPSILFYSMTAFPRLTPEKIEEVLNRGIEELSPEYLIIGGGLNGFKYKNPAYGNVKIPGYELGEYLDYMPFQIYKIDNGRSKLVAITAEKSPFK